ncbi:hypothetical protein [Hyphobacterium sp.]|jgi:hypothetical protein|uniref:hypothetical protein n=1 Tax=Hyphobacterium sp. TaxID=2004662 RepID=UPI003BA871BB
MAKKPRSKKSEALEIRVSHEEKQAFMSAVSQRGTTASHVIREAMDLFVRDGRIRRRNVMISGSLVAVALAAGFVAITDDAESETWAGVAEFNEIDSDRDRHVTLDEFRAYRGTAYESLSGAKGAGAFGAALGALVARYGDRAPSRFGPTAHETPEQISPECWSALEDSWSRATSNEFSNLDANEDELISFQEFSDRQTAQLRGLFRYMDADGNGSLGFDELNPVGPDSREAAAENDYGANTRQEARQLPAHVAICFGPSSEVEQEPLSPEDGRRAAAALMTSWDFDQSGEVSWAEYRDWSNSIRE